MRCTAIIILFLVTVLYAGAQSLDRQIRNLTEEITRGYMDGRDDLLVKPRIGFGDFTEESDGAKKNSAGSLVSVMLADEFSRSTVFSVIERKNLEALMKEYKLSLSGLTNEATAPKLGELQGVELLLLGSVAEKGNSYLITARLVEVETGGIITSAGLDVGRKEIEAESERYIASTFQSPYGITFAPNGTELLEIGGNENNLSISSVDVGYRVTKWLSLSVGYASLKSNELKGLDIPRITVIDDYGTPRNDISRYFNFTGDGVRFGAEVLASPTPRFSLGAKFAAILYFNPILEQDLPSFPVWQPDPNTPGSLVINNGRILVEGFKHDDYASYHLSLSANYLISPRLSIFARAGGFYFPEFIPTSFSTTSEVRDNTVNSDADIDTNGTFPIYQGFNFAKTSTGERVSFSAMGISLQFGIAVNF